LLWWGGREGPNKEEYGGKVRTGQKKERKETTTEEVKKIGIKNGWSVRSP